MPQKPSYSKGRQLRKIKTNRREIPAGVRQAIINSDYKPDVFVAMSAYRLRNRVKPKWNSQLGSGQIIRQYCNI